MAGSRSRCGWRGVRRREEGRGGSGTKTYQSRRKLRAADMASLLTGQSPFPATSSLSGSGLDERESGECIPGGFRQWDCDSEAAREQAELMSGKCVVWQRIFAAGMGIKETMTEGEEHTANARPACVHARYGRCIRRGSNTYCDRARC